MSKDEVGYYTDANGLTWQLDAKEAKRLGFPPYEAPPEPEPPSPVGPTA